MGRRFKKSEGSKIARTNGAYQGMAKDHPDMPGAPDNYKPWKKYWKDWDHFLGTPPKLPKLPWAEGLKKVREAKLPGRGAYPEWKKDHPDMPGAPDNYKPWRQYWKGWKHFLGNEKTD